MNRPNQLRITEIFYSLQGESTTTGIPTVFIRTTGCPLRCTYCDTTYAFKGGQWMDFETMLTTVKSYQCPYVCVTGGEPLAQPHCLPFLTQLCDAGYFVSIETSGAIDIAPIDARVMIVMDLKTPTSGECEKNLMSNIPHLKQTDQVKFVISNRTDYDWTCEIMKQYTLAETTQVLLSPSHGEMAAENLAEWILEDKLRARLQLQLHKILWHDARGR